MTLLQQRDEEIARRREDLCAETLSRLRSLLERILPESRFAETILREGQRMRWHAEPIRRMTLDIPGVRPPIFPRELATPLGELRGFRHVFTHAYDLVLRREKLALLLTDADSVVSGLRGQALRFVEGVAKLHGIRLPD